MDFKCRNLPAPNISKSLPVGLAEMFAWFGRPCMNIYAPPGRFRRYDLFFIDEASQIGDDIFKSSGVVVANFHKSRSL